MSNHIESESESFVIKEFILSAFSYKYFYIACILICISIAIMINRFSTTIYEVNSMIGPVQGKQSSLLGSSDLFKGLGEFGESKNLENDINTLNSFTLVSSTLNKMNLE